MIASADSLPYSDYNPESAVLFCILLRMLYGCGLRRNEALKMETRDIDLNLGVLFVRHAKNDKQRYVPMDISLTELIRAYLSIVPQREYLFVNSTSGRRYSAEWARKRMGHLLQDCGIDFERVRKYERGPCLHCFRHTFVAKAFDQLLQTPLDFADAVPFISTYLGHCDLRETDKYLQANYDFSSETILWLRTIQGSTISSRRWLTNEARYGIYKAVDRIFDSYLPDTKGVSENTIRSYKAALRIFSFS